MQLDKLLLSLFHLSLCIMYLHVALNELVVDRLVSDVVIRDKTVPKGQMSYRDFVWFLLSEEDKTTPRR